MAQSGDDAGRKLSEEELRELMASTDSGGRAPGNRYVVFLIAAVALFWSLFQIWIADPQFWFGELPFVSIMGADQTRPMHLTLALLLAFLCYPALKSSPRDRVPVTDWILAFAAAGSAFYVFWFSREISDTARQGRLVRTELEIFGIDFGTVYPQVIVGCLGLVLLLEAARRTLGPALTVLGALFIAYSFFGTGWLIPELIEHRGRSLNAIINTQWYDTNVGVFGIPLGVSTSFVFLFVLFGALLERAGAGNYFIKIAFAGLGHLRGGPAKAAVVGSGMTGLISGSSIANVVTTGTFTIPLMRRVGLTREKAGAIEVASSVNGQIMPPVMGAAAFLMVEFVGISYLEVIKHAFVPAVISYIALIYIVHLEALRNDIEALGPARSLLQMFLKIVAGFVVAGIGFYALVLGVDLLRGAAPELSDPIMIAVIGLAYLGALMVAARHADLEMDDPNAKEITLPVMKEVFPTGIHFLLPILVLVWFLMVERQSPSKSAFYAVSTMLFIIITQRPIKALLRRQSGVISEFLAGLIDMLQGLITGARNMIGIGVATAAAGIIVGTVTRTPIGTELAGLVEVLAGGQLFLMLVLVAVFSLILGLGLPTTANYIVVSSLMASVVVSVAGQEGLIVPLIAAHLFVFYYGIMADVTPPVGLASFAAAAVSGGDPIRTGLVAFFYSLRTVVLPFLFIYNPALILYGIDLGTMAGLAEATLVFVTATFAMLMFAAATQGYFLAPSYKLESAALLLVAFTFFVPNFWLDRVQAPFADHDPIAVEQVLGEAAPGEEVRITISGPDFVTGAQTTQTLVVDIEEDGLSGSERADAEGIVPMPEDDRMILDEPMPGTPHDDAFMSFDFYDPDMPVEITNVQIPADRMPQEVFYLPALLLLGLVILLQRRRQTKPAF